jgi:hypothetical protein
MRQLSERAFLGEIGKGLGSASALYVGGHSASIVLEANGLSWLKAAR